MSFVYQLFTIPFVWIITTTFLSSIYISLIPLISIIMIDVHPWVPFLCLWSHWFQLLRLHILEFYFYLCDSNVDSSYCSCICEFHFYLHNSIDFAYYDHNLKFLSIGFKLHWFWSLWLYPWVSFIIQVPLILVIA